MTVAPDSRIVVGFDGSAASMSALRWALAEARLRRVPVTVCHVGHWPYGERSAGGEAGQVIRATAEQVLAEGVRYANRHSPDVRLTSELLTGSPAHRLLEAATDAALLVVGARGAGGFRGLLLGSVSAQVARHARCPVIVVHDGGARTAEGTDRRIVVGVDGSPGSEAALAFAFEEAARRHVTVKAIHAWDPSGVFTVAYLPEAELERLRWAEAEALGDVLTRQADKHPDVDVSFELVHSAPGPALVYASADAELLVLGSRGHGGFATLMLGSTSQTLLHHAGCPVAIVHSDG